MIKELGYLDSATVSIVAEDTVAFDTPFWGRFGLSMLLELRAGVIEKHILYDTNSDAAPILHNLRIMGKSLDRVSAIFLSHCHYDHTDGLAGVLSALNRPTPVFAHPQTFRPCFEINPDGIRHIGFGEGDRQKLESRGAVWTLTKSPLNLMRGVLASGEIPRLTSFEPLEDLYTMIDGEVRQDHESDDASLILNFPQGLVIVTGCCHAGIVNTMMHARKISGVDKIHAVIGGLHLIDASEEKLEKSVEALCQVDWVLAGHCTGFEGERRLAAALGERFAIIHTGVEIHLPIQDLKASAYIIPPEVRDRYRFDGL